MDATAAFCYVTSTGRRTGRPHTIEIWFGAAGRTLYVLTFATSDTVRNLLADPRAEVRIGDRRYRATARLLEAGTDEEASARRLLVEKYQAPGATDLEGWGRTALALAFDLDEPSPQV